MVLLATVNFVLSVWNTVFRGFLIKTFWAWFVLTQFPGLPLIGVLPAIGFSYFVGTLTPWKRLTAKDWKEIKTRDSKDEAWLSLINGVTYTFGCGVLLLTGWILHLCIVHWG